MEVSEVAHENSSEESDASNDPLKNKKNDKIYIKKKLAHCLNLIKIERGWIDSLDIGLNDEITSHDSANIFEKKFEKTSPIDDIKKEKIIYEFTQKCLLQSLSKVKENNISFNKPTTCSSSMLKEEEHMNKVKSKMDHLKSVNEAKEKMTEARRMKSFYKKAKEHDIQEKFSADSNSKSPMNKSKKNELFAKPTSVRKSKNSKDKKGGKGNSKGNSKGTKRRLGKVQRKKSFGKRK